MIRPMEMEPTFLNVGLSMSVNGLKTNKMVKVNKPGLIKQFTLVSTKMAKNMVKANLCGQMTVPMKEISSKITFTDSESMNGKMEESTKENGETTKCKAKEHSLGQMEENMSETTSKIENKVTEFSLLRMVEYIKENG